MPRKRNQLYDSLLGKGVENSQKRRLKEGYEFSSKSWLADRIVNKFNTQMDEYEKAQGTERLYPGELLVPFRDKEVVIPILKPKWAKRLVRQPRWAELRPEIETEILTILQKVDPEATVRDVRMLVNQRSLLPLNTGFRWKKFTPPDELGNQKVHNSFQAEPKEDDPEVPFRVRTELTEYLTSAESFSRAKAQAIINDLARERSRFCPLKSDIKPGQIVWIGMDATEFTPFEVKTHDRKQVPLVLTLYTLQEFEQACKIKTLDDFYRFTLLRMERVCFEAYHQGAVLIQQGLHLMFFIHQIAISRLTRKYMELTDIILPIAGTIKDCGRAMTHKKIIVEKHLQGKLNREIARSTHHDEESVDRYIEVFKSVVILYAVGLKPKLMARVLNKSVGVVKEHIEIIESHFNYYNNLVSYLKNQGIEIL